MSRHQTFTAAKVAETLRQVGQPHDCIESTLAVLPVAAAAG